MSIKRFIRDLFRKDEKNKNAPFVIISKDIIEYDNIEAAIAELEKDTTVPKDKMEKVRASFEKLKNNGKVKIKKGEIID